METQYQTSFIPKKPVTTVGPSRSGGVSLFLIVSILIFLISLGLAGYVFLEKNLLTNNIVANAQTIEQNKSGLIADSVTIESLVALNSRINAAKILLGRHIAVSPIFSFLQQATLKSVRFKNFSFSYGSNSGTDQGKVSIQMSGQARDWETVASQADEFGTTDSKKIITEPKISNLSLNVDGSVSFLFSAFVNPDYLVYGTNNNN